jgi:hypothetical protein
VADGLQPISTAEGTMEPEVLDITLDFVKFVRDF